MPTKTQEEKNKIMQQPLKAIVLAAGKGTRLSTEGIDLPKVMRLADGTPLLGHVLKALRFISPEDTVIVVGYQKDKITAQYSQYVFAEQTEQLGTGHAVLSAEPLLRGFDGDVLVCNGDMPLLSRATYEALISAHTASGDDCTILTGTSDVPLPYGRVVRDTQGGFVRVVEDRDCTPAERAITELNSGVYVFKARILFEALRSLDNDNAQREYYLTDVPAILQRGGARIGICRRELGSEIVGVNTPQQLDEVEKILRNRG